MVKFKVILFLNIISYSFIPLNVSKILEYSEHQINILPILNLLDVSILRIPWVVGTEMGQQQHVRKLLTMALNNHIVSRFKWPGHVGIVDCDDLSLFVIELLPERNLILDQSCEKMPFELQNIILEHNKKNYLTKTTVFYNKIKEHEDCIMFFDLPSNVNDFSFKLCSIEGFEVYFRL